MCKYTTPECWSLGEERSPNDACAPASKGFQACPSGACPPGLHPGGAHAAHANTDVMDAAEGPGNPPVTFAELAALLTQAGAFAPAASAAGATQADGGRPTPPAWGRGVALEPDGLASPMSPMALDTLNHATAMAAAHKMALVMGRSFLASGHSSEAGSSSEQEQRSLDEEERTLQV